MGSFSVTVASAPPGALKQALNQSGWVDGEVIAAGQLRQGKAPSIAGLITGTAVIELARAPVEVAPAALRARRDRRPGRRLQGLESRDGRGDGPRDGQDQAGRVRVLAARAPCA